MSGVLDEEGFRPGDEAGRGQQPGGGPGTGDVTVFDFRELEGTGCYCDAGARVVLARAARDFGPGGIHWIDTGDYHYLSKFFLDAVGEPFELLLLDHHSDRQKSAFGGILSCGSWVTEALTSNHNLKSVVSIGPETEGPSSENTQRFPETGGRANAGFREVPPPAELPLYISIDLDVLAPEVFTTNWDQGSMTALQLEAALSAFRNRRILGVDICGGLTSEKGATPATLSRNLAFRRRLLAFLCSNLHI